jgi:hypothetical protein
LPFLISVSSSSSAKINSADSNALNINGSLTQSKEDTSSEWKTLINVFTQQEKNFVWLNQQDFYPVCNVCQLKYYKFVFYFWFWVCLKNVNFVSTSKSFFIPSLHKLAKSVQNLGNFS